MARRYSDLERANLKWFEADSSVASLKAIAIRKGEVRGLKNVRINFDYPITAISGRNGNGKSTIIALAACAFHNVRNGWKLPDRAQSYYTFSDFFVQTRGERPLDGVEVWYQILFDGWTPHPTVPNGIGLGWQASRKRRGGRWSDYDKRVDRQVAFLGVERVVPSVEKSVLRSYRRRFSSGERTGFEEAVCSAVSKVLGVSYDSFEFREHGKHRLPWVVRKKGAGYSGFNMGAGEKALFEFFATVYSAPRGALFLIDEIELGLHEQAQVSLVRALSEICKDRHIQVICTTHSPAVLNSLPPEGRIYMESGAGSSRVFKGVSTRYATGLMSGGNSKELKIYVEDNVAQCLVNSCITGSQRSRVEVCPIGSHAIVLGMMAARFNDQSLGAAIAFLDGDQRMAAKSHSRRFVGLVEAKAGSAEWIESNMSFLPGDMAPEIFVLSKLRELEADLLEESFRYPGQEVIDSIDMALLQSDHDHMAIFSRSIHLEEAAAWSECCRLFARHFPDIGGRISNFVAAKLDGDL